MHCVDLGESFPTSIYLQNLASMQPRTSPVKFASSSSRKFWTWTLKFQSSYLQPRSDSERCFSPNATEFGLLSLSLPDSFLWNGPARKRAFQRYRETKRQYGSQDYSNLPRQPKKQRVLTVLTNPDWWSFFLLSEYIPAYPIRFQKIQNLRNINDFELF